MLYPFCGIVNTSPATPVNALDVVVAENVTATTSNSRTRIVGNASKGRVYAVQFKQIACQLNEASLYSIGFCRHTGFNILENGFCRYHCSLNHDSMKKAYWALRFLCGDSIVSFLEYANRFPGGLPDVLTNAIGTTVNVLPLSPADTQLSEPH